MHEAYPNISLLAQLHYVKVTLQSLVLLLNCTVNGWILSCAFSCALYKTSVLQQSSALERLGARAKHLEMLIEAVCFFSK